MGKIMNFFKELIEAEDRLVYDNDEPIMDVQARNDEARKNALLYHDAYENDYDTEEIKSIKQSLYNGGSSDLDQAYEIAKELEKKKKDNLRKYYDK